MSQDDKPCLRGPRVIMREWCDADLPALADLNQDPRVMQHFPKALTRSESDELAFRIREHFDRHGFGFWAVEVPGVTPFVGLVGLAVPRIEAHFTPCVEIGWRIAHPYWKYGYATEAAREAIRYGFTELGLSEIVSFAVPGNHASRRVMDKLGMTHNREDDFDHPSLAEANLLCRHVLYRLKETEWQP